MCSNVLRSLGCHSTVGNLRRGPVDFYIVYDFTISFRFNMNTKSELTTRHTNTIATAAAGAGASRSGIQFGPLGNQMQKLADESRQKGEIETSVFPRAISVPTEQSYNGSKDTVERLFSLLGTALNLLCTSVESISSC